MAIKAVIFDWGGVIIKNPFLDMMGYSSKFLGIDKDKLANAWRLHEMEYMAGRLSEKQMWKLVCSELGMDLPARLPNGEDVALHSFKFRKNVIKLILTLRKNGYKTGFLSNTEKPTVRACFGKIKNIFDATVISCEDRCVKPQPKIYRLALKRLGVRASEAVFIDDNSKYVLGARGIGMHSFAYHNFKQVILDLKKLGVK